MKFEVLIKIFLLVKSYKKKGIKTKAQSAKMVITSNLKPQNHQFINERIFNSEKDDGLNRTNNILDKERKKSITDVMLIKK